jgi:hypothetical protein
MADSQHVAKSHHTPPTFGSDAMSHQYQAIAWNRQKRVYDLLLAAGVTLYLTLFIGVSGEQQSITLSAGCEWKAWC